MAPEIGETMMHVLSNLRPGQGAQRIWTIRKPMSRIRTQAGSRPSCIVNLWTIALWGKGRLSPAAPSRPIGGHASRFEAALRVTFRAWQSAGAFREERGHSSLSNDRKHRGVRSNPRAPRTIRRLRWLSHLAADQVLVSGSTCEGFLFSLAG